MRTSVASVVAVLAMLFANIAHALDFEVIARYPNGIAKKVRISGEIRRGDYEKFLKFIKTPSPVTGLPDSYLSLSLIELNSSGGSVLEAMKIASKLKLFYPLIDVEENCASSCLLLWLSGAQRYTNLYGHGGRIGIHRPTLPPESLKEMGVKKAEEVFKEFNKSFRDFVLEQGLPQSLYEKLIATNSTEIYWLNQSDLDLIGSSPPYFTELMLAKCLNHNDPEQNKMTPSEAATCIFKLRGDEAFLALDGLLGSDKPPGWDRFKKAYLKQTVKEQTLSGKSLQPLLFGNKQWTPQDNGVDINWHDATKFCANFGDGWRLPTVDELKSIYDKNHRIQCGAFTCPVKDGFNLTLPFLWSGDKVSESEALIVMQFTNSTIKGTIQDGEKRRALCIKG